MRFIFKGMLIIVCSSIFFIGCTPSKTPTQETIRGPSVRVCVADYVRSAKILLNGDAILESVEFSRTLSGGKRLSCTISEKGTLQVRFDDNIVGNFESIFRCYHKNPRHTFEYEGKKYPDTLLFACDGTDLYVINILPVETYLRSVVPNEIGRNRKDEDIEAIKAQAIIARTYTMMKIDLPIKRLFDVYDDTRDQVYTGTSNYTELTTKAVKMTYGKVLIFGDQYAECYFHSTCGGKTEAISLVWQRPQSKPYLVGVSDRNEEGDYCRISPAYRWTELYTRKDLESLLRIYLPSADNTITATDIPEKDWHLLDLRINKRTPSGRISVLEIVMGNRSQKRSYYVHGDKIRWAFRRSNGSGILRSTLFNIYIERDKNRWIRTVRIDGGGSGHGIGLCQWSAISRARKGHTVKKILEAFFPGTTLALAY